MNMARLISWAALRNWDSVAFVFHERTHTFGDIERRSNRLARGLIARGLAKGDRVAILIGNRPEYAEAEFAVAKAGAVRVPLLIQSTTEELRNSLDFAECRFVIASGEAMEKLRTATAQLAVGCDTVAIDDPADDELSYKALIAGAHDAPLDIELSPSDHYAIRFTGGTTGRPKGVIMSHRNMVSLISNTVLNWPIDRSDIGLHIHPLSHAAGMMMYAYWFVGATSVIHPAFRFNAAEFAASVMRHRVTSVFMIPTILNVLMDDEAVRRADLTSIRTIVYGGAPITQARLEQGLERFGPVFLQVYGTSEAPFALTTLHREEHGEPGETPPARRQSAGRPIFNVDVKVIGEDGEAAAAGTIGEVTARSETNMIGYWKNPELTASRVVDGWVRTGDMGYFDEEGYLYIVDRKDDVIITGGFNVWPTEIEDVIARHPAVKEVAVFGVADDRWGEAVTAVAVLREGMTASEAEIISFAAERLAKVKVPKTLSISAGELPKSSVGKLLRREARRIFAAG